MSDLFAQLQARTQNALCPTYGRYPLAVAKAQGSRLFDLDGKEYVDLLAGIAVANLGHSHPEVTKAVCDQAQKLVHVSNLFFQEEQVELAEGLIASCGGGYKAFFCNSGAEANEAAIKLARRHARQVRGKDAWEIVTLEDSFHGRTLATLTATGQPKVKEHFDPLPQGFGHVPFGDLKALDKAITPTTAGVLLEVVQGEGGVKPIGQEYADGVAKLCRERGVLLMVDEIQAGVGRTGAMWAFQHYGLRPDIFTAAKGLANGLPLGAMLATDEVAQGFAPGSHATTFGGNGLCCAAGLAVLKVLEQEKLIQRAAEVGEKLRNWVEELAATRPIAEVRGLGLMVGIRLNLPPDTCQKVWATLLEKGFVLNLTQGDVLRLLPPLTIPEEDLKSFVAALNDVLAKVGA